MAEGRVAAVFKLNVKGFDLRRGVALSVVMLVPPVVLGVLVMFLAGQLAKRTNAARQPAAPTG